MGTSGYFFYDGKRGLDFLGLEILWGWYNEAHTPHRLAM
jgi:hypothetical protein